MPLDDTTGIEEAAAREQRLAALRQQRLARRQRRRVRLQLIGEAIARGWLFVTRDIAVLAGIAAIAYGAWLVLPAAGYIAGGLLLLLAAAAITLNGDRES